ncbi:MAG: redox-sensitive transcriptional activator SoxR [Rhodobacterales bacterium]|nr:MAG: redox-sensitive transcriptional activator SoxR [Rhodobacterales bacterium]
MPKPLKEFGLSIGEVARRTGLAVSAVRFYADEGLVFPERAAGGGRRFTRADLRRISFVMVAQKLGFSLKDIRTRMAALPRERGPNKTEWAAISRDFRTDIDARIAQLEALRDKLDGCIGCGCLSLDACALYNPEDKIAAKGTGPRYLLGDKP